MIFVTFPNQGTYSLASKNKNKKSRDLQMHTFWCQQCMWMNQAKCNDSFAYMDKKIKVDMLSTFRRKKKSKNLLKIIWADIKERRELKLMEYASPMALEQNVGPKWHVRESCIW